MLPDNWETTQEMKRTAYNSAYGMATHQRARESLKRQYAFPLGDALQTRDAMLVTHRVCVYTGATTSRLSCDASVCSRNLSYASLTKAPLRSQFSVHGHHPLTVLPTMAAINLWKGALQYVTSPETFDLYIRAGNGSQAIKTLLSDMQAMNVQPSYLDVLCAVLAHEFKDFVNSALSWAKAILAAAA